MAPFRGFGWRIGGTVALAGLLAYAIHSLLAPSAIPVPASIPLSVLAIGWILNVWFTRSVAQSLRAVSAAAQRLAEGDFSARVPRLAGDELDAVGRGMNRMAEQIQRRVQELESQRNQAQAILESMVEGVAALDREERVLWLNTSAQRLFGVTPEQAAGKRLTELFRQPEIEALIKEVLSQRRPAVREVHTFPPQERSVRVQAAPCEGGAMDAALVLVAQDVTEMRRLEGMRREFVANVSHELKTPLTSIKGLVETLLSGALEDAANNRRFVSLIDEDTTRLTRLIDDLLELSQIESKAVPLRLESVNVRELVESVMSRFRSQCSDRRVTCENTIASSAPSVRGDAERLRQVFVNLLDNALKFNKPGGHIKITAKPRNAFLEVLIEDTGIGIPEADLPRIFERFYRVDKTRARELGGTGLGLAIVKHIVELHQGSVSVQSRLGQGTTFAVSLPLWSARSSA